MARSRCLLIAYHYPPCRGSSGLQRSLCFSRYLGQYGWDPVVLSAQAMAYPQVGEDQLGDIPGDVPVVRSWALDTSRHLAVGGRYPGLLALPDRWISWVLSGVPAGLRAIRKYRPQVLWSTYPIATAHLIGYILHRLSGIPWVADFRDPMAEEDPVTHQRWPGDPLLWAARCSVERRAILQSQACVFVTAGARRLYADRYERVPSSKWHLIPNGFDEDVFARAEAGLPRGKRSDGPVTLLHSGVLYPTPDRDPSAFFGAIGSLKRAGKVSGQLLKVVLRASGSEALYRKLIAQSDIGDIVILAPPIGYQDAITEMMTVDGLLLFQGHDSNPAIPAKFYEYLRAQRPIFAMVDDAGETAHALTASGVGTLAPLDDKGKIESQLSSFLRSIHEGNRMIADAKTIARYSRQAQTEQLARIFDQVAGARLRG